MSAVVLAPDTACWVCFIGLMLLWWELIRPGLVVPGVSGLGLLVWGGYALSRYAVDPLAVFAFVSTGLGIAIETMWSSRGVVAVATLLCLAAGSNRLITQQPHLAPAVVWFCTLCAGGVGLTCARLARRARDAKRRDLTQ
jgi:membrane-bound ClpP family serine protease